VAARLARLAAAVRKPESVESAGRRIVRAAPLIVAGTSMAGLIAVRGDGTVETRACTDGVVMSLDRLQSHYGEGPGLAACAAQDAVTIAVMDTTADRRWPRFGAAAARLGVRSMISCSLPLQGSGAFALNLHAPRPGAFDAVAVEHAAFFAAYAALALDQARLAQNLGTALTSRQAIGEASGILMERHRIGSAEAFARLSAASQRLNVKLWRVAAHVVRTGAEPDEIRLADLSEED
jgi:GAF domain-containing protein